MKNIGKKKINKLPQNHFLRTPHLSLFQTFLCNDEAQRDRLSNTIDLWDGIPKYFVSRQDMNTRRNVDGYLPSLEKTFEYKGNTGLAIATIPASYLPCISCARSCKNAGIPCPINRSGKAWK